LETYDAYGFTGVSLDDDHDHVELEQPIFLHPPAFASGDTSFQRFLTGMRNSDDRFSIHLSSNYQRLSTHGDVCLLQPGCTVARGRSWLPYQDMPADDCTTGFMDPSLTLAPYHDFDHDCLIKLETFDMLPLLENPIGLSRVRI